MMMPEVPRLAWRCSLCDQQAVVTARPSVSRTMLEQLARESHHRISPDCAAGTLEVKYLDITQN
jgi:hypothetical protein